MKTIVCVLKTGVFTPRKDVSHPYSASYGPEHVLWLRNQFSKSVRTSHRFVCLSNIEIPTVETIPLQDDLPGWWSKLELFREFDNAFYVDLDTVLVGDVSKYIFAPHRFTVSSGINILDPDSINSSLMAWDGDYSFIYKEFMENKDQIMSEYVVNAKWGDQAFIKHTAKDRIVFEKFQDKFPGSILSYSRDLKGQTSMYSGRYIGRYQRPRAKIGPNWMHQPRFIFFNGHPKPWEIGEQWIPKLPPVPMPK